MEPLDDNELSSVLRQWKAPDAPASVERRVLAERRPWWAWLWAGSVRIPVPVGLAAILILAIWIYSNERSSRPAAPAAGPADAPAEGPTAGPPSLAGFEPVPALEPTIVGGRR